MPSGDSDCFKSGNSSLSSRPVTPQPQDQATNALIHLETLNNPDSPCTKLQRYKDLTWHRFLISYRSIFGFVFGLNVLALFLVLYYKNPDQNAEYYRQWIPVCSSVNFLSGSLVRNEYFVNMIFKVMLLAPLSLPLRIRHVFAQVHHYGGLHSGCHTAGTMWAIAITAMN